MNFKPKLFKSGFSLMGEGPGRYFLVQLIPVTLFFLAIWGQQQQLQQMQEQLMQPMQAPQGYQQAPAYPQQPGF